MSFTVRLAVFPPWEAPIPSEVIGTYATEIEASAAGMQMLIPIAEREIAALAISRNAVSPQTGDVSTTSVAVPGEPVHGYIIYDAEGAEVGNWTTLDIAIDRAARDAEANSRPLGPDDPIKLSRLRDIGWREWDPIGLLSAGETWTDQPFADEYDRYLLKAARDLRSGAALADAVEYLMGIEREHMAIGVRDGQRERAEATARSIQRYVTKLDT